MTAIRPGGGLLQSLPSASSIMFVRTRTGTLIGTPLRALQPQAMSHPPRTTSFYVPLASSPAAAIQHMIEQR